MRNHKREGINLAEGKTAMIGTLDETKKPYDTRSAFHQMFEHHYERTDKLGPERDEEAIARFCGMLGDLDDEGRHYHPSRKQWPMFRDLHMPQGIYHVRTFRNDMSQSQVVRTADSKPIDFEGAYIACAVTAHRQVDGESRIWLSTRALPTAFTSVLDLEVVLGDVRPDRHR